VANLEVAYDGRTYPAGTVASGAAYEIFADAPEPGFLRNPQPGVPMPYHRFVAAADVEIVAGEPPTPTECALSAPLSRALTWDTVHRLSQTPPAGTARLLGAIRGSVRVRRGTRMVKVLSGRQLAGHLQGWLPHGFCYREFDIAHLRTPADLRVLLGDDRSGATDPDEAVFALRWRAVDPADYQVPFATEFDGLVRMPPRDRLAAPVIGTGFAPSSTHLIPEFVTADLSDLPLPAFAELLAYTGDGSEVLLYQYLPEQRSWVRLAGPQWRRLFAAVPGIAPEQEYFPLPATPVRLVGWYRDQEYEAVADPPDEFRLLAKTRAARYPVEALARRTPYARWRGVPCTLTRQEGDWLLLRLIRPDAESVAATRASCVERGVYEVWAPRYDVTDGWAIDTWYDIRSPEAAPTSPAPSRPELHPPAAPAGVTVRV
jgi:hypothetical protein